MATKAGRRCFTGTITPADDAAGSPHQGDAHRARQRGSHTQLSGDGGQEYQRGKGQPGTENHGPGLWGLSDGQ